MSQLDTKGEGGGDVSIRKHRKGGCLNWSQREEGLYRGEGVFKMEV